MNDYRLIVHAYNANGEYLLGLTDLSPRKLLHSSTGPGPAAEGGGFEWLETYLKDKKPALWWTTMPGDAMDPTIRHSEVIGVDTAVGQIVSDGIYALQWKGALMVRRAQRLGAGITLSADNKAYAEIQLAGTDSPTIVGPVVCILRFT